MHETINEPVDVLVDFAGAKVKPLEIRWNKRIYPIASVNLVHATHEGEKRVYFFSVSDQAHMFTLKLYPELLQWTLVSVYEE